jgi:hypothetical protein
MYIIANILDIPHVMVALSWHSSPDRSVVSPDSFWHTCNLGSNARIRVPTYQLERHTSPSCYLVCTAMTFPHGQIWQSRCPHLHLRLRRYLQECNQNPITPRSRYQPMVSDPGNGKHINHPLPPDDSGSRARLGRWLFVADMANRCPSSDQVSAPVAQTL